ncbi:acyltransferase [Aquabacterium sp. A3]|uniref:acyltransferase family protein n=1 Tax=Aquabacterium sp. A3 TaxID=3132829 RepID=UPI00311A4184
MLTADQGSAVKSAATNVKPGFELDATNACKGVALLLLLWHHLFYKHPEYGVWVYQSALFAKVCVAIFVLLSGYGFSRSVSAAPAGVAHFYRTRLVPLYMNYWFVALIFVTIGVCAVGVSLQGAYNGQPYLKFLVQMTGLHRYVYPEYGYNATWWYMSVIIPLTLLFPLLHPLMKGHGAKVLTVLLLLLLIKRPVVPVLNEWLFPFALGIYMAQRETISLIAAYLQRLGPTRFAVLFLGLAFVMLFRTYSPVLSGTRIDWLFAVLIIVLTYEVGRLSRLLQRSLAYLGGHLFNIFLFHTFVYAYFWRDFIYASGHPAAIFVTLLLVCLAVSEVLERIKQAIGFHVAVRRLRGRPATES